MFARAETATTASAIQNARREEGSGIDKVPLSVLKRRLTNRASAAGAMPQGAPPAGLFTHHEQTHKWNVFPTWLSRRQLQAHVRLLHCEVLRALRRYDIVLSQLARSLNPTNPFLPIVASPPVATKTAEKHGHHSA